MQWSVEQHCVAGGGRELSCGLEGVGTWWGSFLPQFFSRGGEGGGDLIVAGDIGSSSMSFPPIYHPSSAVVGLINWEDERLPDPKLRNQIQVKQSCPED